MEKIIYPKFYAPYKRNVETGFIDPEQPQRDLKPYMNDSTKWWVSEKMDGTNTRIIWDGYKVNVMGRTASSQLQGYQNELLRTLIENDNYKFDETFGTQPVIIYGEAIGGKIQKNPHGVEPQFQVFDVNIDGVWLEYQNVQEISENLGLTYNDHVLFDSWDKVIDIFKDMKKARNDYNQYFEGIVAVPENMPLTRTGERVITKIKVKDFDWSK